MNKLDMESKNIVNENIQKISELFPNETTLFSSINSSINFEIFLDESDKKL